MSKVDLKLKELNQKNKKGGEKMKTIKIMSIIGIVWGALSLLCLIGFNTPVDYDAAIGWGILGMLYFIPFSIVCLVKSVGK